MKICHSGLYQNVDSYVCFMIKKLQLILELEYKIKIKIKIKIERCFKMKKSNKKKAEKRNAKIEKSEIIKKYKGSAVVSEYNGKPILRLPTTDDGKYFFQFGLTKAKAIMNNIQAIDKFIKDFDK